MWWVVGVVCLTGIEVCGTAAATHWARSGSAVAGVATATCFAGLGFVLGWTIRASDHRMTVVNTLWQASSIVAVAVLGAVGFRETLTARQVCGVALAAAACLCV